MKISTRYFIFRAGCIKKISRKKIDEFYLQEETSFFEYAGEIIDCAEVLVSVDGRKVVGLIDIRPIRWKVNNKGSLDKEYDRKYLRYRMGSTERTGIIKDGPIIRAEEVFNKVRLKTKFDWNVTSKEVGEIVKQLGLVIHSNN